MSQASKSEDSSERKAVLKPFFPTCLAQTSSPKTSCCFDFPPSLCASSFDRQVSCCCFPKLHLISRLKLQPALPVWAQYSLSLSPCNNGGATCWSHLVPDLCEKGRLTDTRLNLPRRPGPVPCPLGHSWHVPVGVARPGIMHVHVRGGSGGLPCQLSALCRCLYASGMTDSRSMWFHNGWRLLSHPFSHSVLKGAAALQGLFRLCLHPVCNFIPFRDWEQLHMTP